MEFFVVLAKHHGHLSLYKVADRRRFLFLFSIFIVYIIIFFSSSIQLFVFYFILHAERRFRAADE